MSETTIRPVDVINDLYDADCALDKVTAAANAMYELFFERAYVEHELNKGRHEFMVRMFSVMMDQLFALKKELGEVLDNYTELYNQSRAELDAARVKGRADA